MIPQPPLLGPFGHRNHGRYAPVVRSSLITGLQYLIILT